MSGAKAPYFQDASDFASQDQEILKAVECVANKTGDKGIRVMDWGATEES